jgi:glycosyltransferase involved in cell wall biosynthesis
MTEQTVAVLLPALNEAKSVETVVEGFLGEGVRVVLVDNGSTDGSRQIAAQAGAEVVSEERRGYGSACLAGLSYLKSQPPSIVVFADCDGTLDPRDLQNLISPIKSGRADLVLGRRARVENGALPLHQRLGNAIALVMLRALYGLAVNDIPPYRAVRWPFLVDLGLSERTYGLPIETLAEAARRKGRVEEVNVAYRRRFEGKSKVTGSLRSSLQAGWAMLSLLVVLRFRKR